MIYNIGVYHTILLAPRYFAALMVISMLWKISSERQNGERHASNISSSSGCGAGNYIQAFSMHIDLWQVQLSHLLIFQLHDILTPLDVRNVRGAWTTWLPFTMRWYIKSISSCRLFLWKTKDVSKETQLALSYIIHKRLSVGHGINSNVGYAVLSFYPKNNTARC